ARPLSSRTYRRPTPTSSSSPPGRRPPKTSLGSPSAPTPPATQSTASSSPIRTAWTEHPDDLCDRNVPSKRPYPNGSPAHQRHPTRSPTSSIYARGHNDYRLADPR